MLTDNLETKKGFTLIELLVVISIIALLSSVVLTSLGSARVKARNTVRKSTMRQIQLALELYYDDTGSYPFLAGTWYSSNAGGAFTYNGADWIPGIDSTYMSVLPDDPQSGFTSHAAPCVPATHYREYIYRSDDGTGYSLLSHCAPEGTWTSSDPFYDPVRAAYAWKVCGGNSSQCF